ncbi:MAG: CPBP family intramembrane metalloprotease [Chloroflexi bacterium]|nr:CPBP family intramembrane metalloprotease [Chloroflexota bacterium]
MSIHPSEALKLCKRCNQMARQAYDYCSRCGSRSWVAAPQGVSQAASPTAGYGGKLGIAPWTVGDLARGIGFFTAQAFTIFLLFILATLLIEDANLGLYALVVTFILEGVLLATVWIFAVAKYRISWRALGLWRLPNAGDVILAGSVFLVGIGVQVGYLSILKLIGVDTGRVTPTTFIEEGGVVLVLLSILALAVAPVAEEIFFRGFIFGGAATRYGFIKGALASAALFSIAHIEPLKFLPLFVLGFLLAWIYHKTGALWGSMIAHLLNNALALLVVILT